MTEQQASRGSITTNHSGHILDLALQAFDRSKTSPAEAEVALILAAVALEGFLNELGPLGARFGGHLATRLRHLLESAEAERVQPVFKYALAYFALTGDALDRGSLVAQDIEALFGLRNLIVHLRPTSIDVLHTSPPTYVPPKWSKSLRHLMNRKVVTIRHEWETWLNLVANPEVAKWACNTVIRAMKSLVGNIPESDFATIMRRHHGDRDELA